MSPHGKTFIDQNTLSVPHHRQQMSVGLDRKRLETPLIQVPRPAGFVASVPTHRVHDSEATEELADLITEGSGSARSGFPSLGPLLDLLLLPIVRWMLRKASFSPLRSVLTPL